MKRFPARVAQLGLAAVLLAACSAQSPANREPAEPASNTTAPPPGSSSASLANGAQASPGKPVLAVDGDGLRLVDPKSGSARGLPFGLGRMQVMDAMGFLRAPAETGMLPECSAGPLDRAAWSNGPTLYFQHNRFAGWAIGGREEAAAQASLTTVAGIGLGSTRAQLESAYDTEVFESSLGTEFAAGKLFGVLDGPGRDARITHLWAGVSCVMR